MAEVIASYPASNSGNSCTVLFEVMQISSDAMVFLGALRAASLRMVDYFELSGFEIPKPPEPRA
jgi:hypothetical protein